MRNRGLHDALRDFALEAAALLQEELKAGAEIAFEVVEEPGSGAVLYRYRPLTSDFIGDRWAALTALPSRESAARALGAGAASYLRMQGAPGIDAEPALRAMLERLYEDATSFEFPEERFERVYWDVERTLYEDSVPARVLAPLPGLLLEHARVELGDGLALIAGEAADAPPEAVWPEARERSGDPNALCVLERDIRTDMPLPVTEARIRFRRLVTALRLFKAGAVALGPLAWARAEVGAWQPVSLGSAGHLRGEAWALGSEEEEDLRELLDLLARSRHGGTVAWALSRFEMGCERAVDTEALSDYLLALRALLDGSDDAGRASLSLRLAALCAEESDRRALQRRVELAFALERFVIGGGSGDAYVETIGSESPRDLVLEVEDNLRALLRDVLCGYLEPGLKSVADDILLRSAEPFEIEARDMRRRFHRQPEPEPELVPEPEPRPATGDGRRATGEPQPTPEAERPAEPAPQPEEDLSAGVTPSADWEFDEDPESYSAPV
jgi:hypothetical protein